MSNRFDTDIGKIYCAYNKETDSFDKIRVIDIDSDHAMICDLDEYNHISTDRICSIPLENLEKIKKDTVLLQSDGITSISNIISLSSGDLKIKDILMIFFPTHKISKAAEPYRPYIVARQGIDNIFAAMANQNNVVGMSVSIDTLPAGYALSDFMGNEKVLSSRLTHTYKTDTEEDIAILLKNDESDTILKSLYDHAINFHHNTDKYYEHEEVEDDCVDGYCNSLKRFILESDFIGELQNNMGIVKVDFDLTENIPIEKEDKLLLSTLCGGIRINKAVPLKFDYDINMDAVKMRYIIVCDASNHLFIIPYTVSDNEIDADAVYKMTEEATNKLQERLKRVVKAYDASQGIESGSPFEVLSD